MARTRIAIILILATLSLFAFPVAGHSAAKEQIVFSGEGDGSVGEIEFWIWCAVDEAGAYDDCAGAIRFDESKVAKHVEGEVAELDEGEYEMDVSSADGTIACTLTNVPPITHGPSNRIDISCTAPAGTATSWDAVVAGNA